MKKRILIIIVLCIVLSLIVVGIVFGINKLKESTDKINKEYDKDVELLQTNYDNFINYITEFNDSRTELATLMKKAMYYEDLPDVSDNLNEFYVTYDSLIGKIVTSVENMNQACKREYMEVEYNDMCDSYQITYEKLLNIFYEDVKSYNKLITDYNTWAESDKYQVFESSFVKDYIDYNNDNVFEGKTEEEKASGEDEE